MMSRATVYKTLDTLKAAGEVLELEFREGPNRYDPNMPSAHPRVVCGRRLDAEVRRSAESNLKSSGDKV